MQVRNAFAAAALAAFSLACSRAVTVESGGEVAAVTPVNASYLPPGTTIEVQLDQAIGAQQSHVGDGFTAHVSQAVIAQNGSTAVPSGSVVTGVVTGVQSQPDPTKPALIRLDFQELQFNGRAYPFEASVQKTAVPGSNNDDLLKKAGIGAAAGAVLGAVIGGGDLKDILVGGAIGAAAGSLISLGTGGDERLPAGTRMTLRTTQTVALR